MKNYKNLFGLIMVAAAISLFVYSCTKDDEGNLSETDIALAQDDTYVDALYDEIDNLVVTEIATLDENFYSTEGLKSTLNGNCYTVTVDHPDTTTFPKIVTLDFGEGCTVVFNGDSITRSGQIQITLSDRWFREDAELVVTYQNFYFNGAKVEGIRTMINLGLNEQHRLEISIQLQNGKIIFDETTWVSRNASHIHAWAMHLNPLEDTVFVTGAANGTNVLGEAYNREITESLVLVRCAEYKFRWVVAAGKVEIANSKRGNITVDHTDSGCSGDVVIHKDDKQFTYQFRYRYTIKSEN